MSSSNELITFAQRKSASGQPKAMTWLSGVRIWNWLVCMP